MQDVSSLKIFKSQQGFCRSVVDTVLKNEAFVLLTGDSGSGRTTMCEQVVSETDGRCFAVFIPCQKDMTPAVLRQLFLQQLLPNVKWDLNLKLPDILARENISVKEKILVVIDDADKVVSTFLEELLAVYNQSLGLDRFSFIAVGHPLWAQEILSSTHNLDHAPVEMTMPSLTIDEAMFICKSIFTANGLAAVYTAISGDLPASLEGCKGNISRILKTTEKLMAEPSKVTDEKAASADTAKSLDASTPKKKHSSVGIFISIVCIIIVLACLVPLFLGTDIFGKKEPVSTEPELAEDVTMRNYQQDSDPFMDNDSSDGTDLTDTQPKAQDNNAVANDSTVDYATADSGSGAENNSSLESITSDGPKGTAAEPAVDNGDLLSDVNGGVEATTPEAKTHNSVTLSGEALDRIEKGEAESKDSEHPRPGVAGSVDNNSEEQTADKSASQTDAATTPAAAGDGKFIQRADNSLRTKEIEEEKAAQSAALAAQKAKEEADLKAEREAKEKAEKEQQALAQRKAEAEKKAQEDRKRAEEAAKAEQHKHQNAQADTRKPQGAVNEKRVVPSGNAVPGAASELSAKNSGHYTLQVVAGRNRDAVVQVSAVVNGRYWIYETVREGKPWYVLITGDYASPNAALRDAAKLPASIRSAGPFAKTFDKVKTEMSLGRN